MQKIEGFNTDLAVRVLADIEEAKIIGAGAHRQESWGLATEQVVSRLTTTTLTNGTDSLDVFVGNGSGDCGTAQCFAGWTMVETDQKLVYIKSTKRDAEGDDLVDTFGYHVGGVWNEETQEKGLLDSVSEVATELIFGRTPDCGHYNEAGYATMSHRLLGCPIQKDHPDGFWYDFQNDMPNLFRPDNTLDQIYEMVAAYADISVMELKLRVADQQAKFRIEIGRDEDQKPVHKKTELCLCVFEDGELVRTDDGCPEHSKRPGVRSQKTPALS